MCLRGHGKSENDARMVTGFEPGGTSRGPGQVYEDEVVPEQEGAHGYRGHRLESRSDPCS